MIETQFPPPVDVDEIRQHVREALPGFNNAPPEINRLANDVQPLLRAYDALRAENERLRADQRLLDESVRNQAIRESIHKEELKRLRAIVDAAQQCPVCRVAHKDLFAALQDESPR